MSPLTRLTNIQLSLIHVHPLSDVPILDALMSFACVRRHASFPLASHLAVSSNAVRVRYAVVRFNRVRIELTFYHYSLKRTHNLGLGGGPNFRWQYSLLSNIKYKLSSFEADLKTRKYGINPLVDCFHASYLPILMEIRTEVLIPKIA